MPAPAWEDLGEFLDPEEFAVSVTITLLNGSTRQVVGIFDDPYLNAQLGEYEADTSEPRFTARESDLAGVTRGCTVTVAGGAYDVMTAAQPDGTGMSIVRMAPQP